MDPSQFDYLSKAVAAAGSRRTLARVLAALPLVGAGRVLAEDAGARRRQDRDRRERDRDRQDERGEVQEEKKKKKVTLCLNGQTIRVAKKKRKTFINQGATAGACVPPTCIPDNRATTCEGNCGAVQNNCGQVVDCGPCTCSPACETCERCVGTVCETCDPCCDGFCCDRAGAICNAITGSCCVPASDAVTCANKCGTVTNNCGIDVDCGGCANPTPICAANVCVACSGTNPCPNGQVCCGGSCFAGVCCDDADCPSQGGNDCDNNQCLCSGVAACSGSTPDCCGTPGTCTNTDTDTNNCGTCGTTCSDATPNCVNGTCVADVCASGCPFNSVQAAINTFSAGSTIYIGAGTYGRITLGKNMTLIGTGDGSNPANNTILDGLFGGTVVTINPAVVVTLQGLRIIRGQASTGAGIYNNAGANLTMTGCTVTGNVGTAGGGGGGIMNWSGSTLTMTNCKVDDNSTGASGGGIFTFGSVTLTNCTVSNNRAPSGTGGGLGNGVGGSTTLNNTTVTGNTSLGNPAGVRCDPGTTVTLTGSSSVSGNSPGNCGGGGTFVGGGCAA